MLLTDKRITEIVLLGVLTGLLGLGGYLYPWLNDPVHRENIGIAAAFTILALVFILLANKYADQRGQEKPRSKSNS